MLANMLLLRCTRSNYNKPKTELIYNISLDEKFYFPVQARNVYCIIKFIHFLTFLSLRFVNTFNHTHNWKCLQAPQCKVEKTNLCVMCFSVFCVFDTLYADDVIVYAMEINRKFWKGQTLHVHKKKYNAIQFSFTVRLYFPFSLVLQLSICTLSIIAFGIFSDKNDSHVPIFTKQGKRFTGYYSWCKLKSYFNSKVSMNLLFLFRKRCLRILFNWRSTWSKLVIVIQNSSTTQGESSH